MGITTDGQLDIVGNLNLNHGWLIADDFLDSEDDLVDIFPMDFLASLKPLRHVIDELLGHSVA